MMIIRAKLHHQKRTYRDIIVSPKTSLYDFAGYVVAAFGFDFDHCFGYFSSPDIYGQGKNSRHYELFYDIGEEIDELTESVKHSTISELFKNQKDTWWMLFDYGDDWIFELVYQKDVSISDRKKPTGSIVASNGDAPEQYPDWE